MEFTWTTFFLEILNFLVLLWILQRLLYKPIKKVILDRKAEVQEAVDAANKLKKEATELREKYENREKEWEKEKEERMLQLQHEIQDEKKRRLVVLENTLKVEKEKALAQEEQRIASLVAEKEKIVIANSIKLSAQFLKSFADVELENKILMFFLKALENLNEEKIAALKKEVIVHDNNNPTIQIQSAFPLTDEQKKQITSCIEKISGQQQLIYNFTVNPELLAGFQLSIGSIVLDANLRHELKIFAEVQMHD